MPFSDRFRDLEHLIAETVGDAVEGVRRSLAGEVRRRTTELARESRQQTLGELRASLRRLDRASGQTELLTALLEEAAHFASRSALLLTFEPAARGWGAFGFAQGAAAMADLALDYQGGWAELRRGTGCVRLEGSDCAALCAHLQSEPPEEGILVPLVLRDRVAAVLYADRVGDETPFEPAALQLLTLTAAQLLELQALRQRRVTATLYEASEGGEGLPLWAPGEAPDERAQEPTEPMAAGAEAPAAEVSDRAADENEERAEEGRASQAVEPLEVLEPEREEPGGAQGAWGTARAPEIAPPAEVAAAETEREPWMAPPEPVPAPEADEEPWSGLPAAAEPEEPRAEGYAPLAPPAFEQETELFAEGEAEEQPAAWPEEGEELEDAEGFALEQEQEPALEPAGEEVGWEDEPEELESTASMPRAEAGGESTVRLSREMLDRHAAIPDEPTAAEPPEAEIEPSEDRTVLLQREELAPPEAPSAPAPAYREPTTAQPAGHGAGSTEVTPPPDLEGPGWAFREQGERPSEVPHRDPEQAVLHEEARRLARLLVSEIKLYNEEQVEEGRRNRDLYSRLQEDIDRSRQMYEERVDPRVRDETDYFQQEMVNILAGGDAGTLGI
jgi:hypothetical protein